MSKEETKMSHVDYSVIVDKYAKRPLYVDLTLEEHMKQQLTKLQLIKEKQNKLK